MEQGIMVFLFSAIGLLFVGLAIPLVNRKIGPNHLYGLRVRATLEDEAVWYEANARSGRDLLWLGVVIIGLSVGLNLVPWVGPELYPSLCLLLVVLGVSVYCFRGVRIAKAVEAELLLSNKSVSCEGDES